MDENGQATPLLAVLVLAVGGLLVALARFGADASHIAQAQSAADAAALAGAAEGRDGAERLAGANGGSITAYDARGREVEVRAQVGDGWAVARAVRTGGGGAITGWVGVDGSGGAAARLSPRLRAALDDAATMLRQPVPIEAAAGSWVVVPTPFVARLASVADRAGLCQQRPQVHPVRFVLCPESRG
jgi:hypothetical protein